MSNIDRYKQLMECFKKEDIEGIRSLVDENVTTENRAPESTGISGDCHGIDDFLNYMKVAGNETAEYEFLESYAWLEDGDLVVALGREKFTIRSTGRTMETPFAHETRWNDGKLVFMREYYDTAALRDAWTK